MIHFPDQSTHAYLIPTIDETLCFCNYKAKSKHNKKTTLKSSFSFGNHKIFLR